MNLPFKTTITMQFQLCHVVIVPDLNLFSMTSYVDSESVTCSIDEAYDELLKLRNEKDTP